MLLMGNIVMVVLIIIGIIFKIKKIKDMKLFNLSIFAISHIRIKKENKKKTYIETILSWKKSKILVVEYFSYD